MIPAGPKRILGQHRNQQDNKRILCLAKAIAAVLVGVKFFFLREDYHSLQSGHRPPSRLRYDRGEPSLRLEFHLGQHIDNITKGASFKILQLGDIHLGEASWTDWGPEQDRKTFEVLDCVIPEEKPDLIVLSGDQLTANDVRLNATSYYSLLGQHLSRFGIPWCLIFGNHDDQAFEIRLPNGTIIKEPAETSRAELLAVDQGFPLSLTQAGPKTVFGSSNYALDVHYPSAWENHAERTRPEPNGLVAMQLIFLDSGGGSLPQQLQQNQIDWFRRIYRNDTAAAAAFQHIPTYDFAYDGSLCHGMQKDPVDSVSKDPGIVHTLQQAGNVMWLGVGHNHGNDYCCRVNRTGLEPMPSSSRQMLALCFGRHSGYGGYNRGWDRGARIYQVFLRRNVTQQSVTTEWNSWARLESGEIIDRYAPV